MIVSALTNYASVVRIKRTEILFSKLLFLDKQAKFLTKFYRKTGAKGTPVGMRLKYDFLYSLMYS